MENCFQDTPGRFWIPCHAFWPHQCSKPFSSHTLTFYMIFKCFCFCLPWQHPYLLQRPSTTYSACPRSFTTSPRESNVRKSWEIFLGFIFEKGYFQTDPQKVNTVAELQIHTDRRQLQGFLGFTNFYRRVIKDYSRVAAPLPQLTSTLKTFKWNPKANSVFGELKQRFISAPTFHHPVPSQQFVVEVDASDTGVGAFLSQMSVFDNKVHPCT